jgi:hypothetical protein
MGWGYRGRTPQRSWAQLVTYALAQAGQGEPPLPSGALYQYVWTADGIYVQARRRGMRLLIPHAFAEYAYADDALTEHASGSAAEAALFPGLAKLEPYIALAAGRLPERLLLAAWEASRTPAGACFRETLHLFRLAARHRILDGCVVGRRDRGVGDRADDAVADDVVADDVVADDVVADDVVADDVVADDADVVGAGGCAGDHLRSHAIRRAVGTVSASANPGLNARAAVAKAAEEAEAGVYEWLMPAVDSAGGHVRLIEVPPEYGDTLIELHTHPAACHRFSAADDRDEVGFRIYALLADVDSNHPAVRARVSVYGHRFDIPARWAFELPAGMRDLVQEDIDACRTD